MPRYYLAENLGKGISIIEGLPDVGLVGTIAASYIVSKLNSTNVGYIEVEGLPPIVTVHNARLYEPCRLYVCDDSGKRFGVVYSDVPIPPTGLRSTAESLTEISSKLEAPSLISIGGIAEPDRLEIDRPQVYVLSNDEATMEMALKVGNSIPFENGFITGMKAALLKEAVRKNVKMLVALAQSHMNYPDPGASAEILAFLNKLLGLNIPIEPLLQQAEQLKLQLRDLMRRTASQLAQLPKGLELEQAPPYIR